MKKIALIVASVCGLCLIYTSCEDDDAMSMRQDRIERSSIVNSLEFQEYLASEMALYQEFVRFAQSVQSVNQSDTVSDEQPVFDMSLVQTVSEKKSVLVSLFPILEQYGKVLVKQMAREALSEHREFFSYWLANDPSHPVPLTKDFSYEEDGWYRFGSQDSAFIAAWEWSTAQGKECGGHEMNSSYYVLYLNSSATINHGELPIPGDGATAVFHTHPGGNPEMSPTDSSSMRNYLPNGTMYIIYGLGQYSSYGPFLQ